MQIGQLSIAIGEHTFWCNALFSYLQLMYNREWEGGHVQKRHDATKTCKLTFEHSIARMFTNTCEIVNNCAKPLGDLQRPGSELG